MSDSNSIPNDDRAQIETVMKAYVEGGRSGNVDTLRPIFHGLATICGYVGSDLFAAPIEEFYEWHENNGPAVDLMAREAQFDIQGTAATVRLELNNWTGHRFTDFFTLVKIEGQWQIMSKVFYLHPE
ncbi:MAG: nuclear transport factor 2 family protein [Gammaproteobacteria bacterium]|jgi:hypothetical protein|nr:nuclear transport factor 2 family protein [Gammaproteobacteria bacterium]